MTEQKLKVAIDEANRFLLRAAALHKVATNYGGYRSNPIEQGAVRRASMDLTRALANLRKST